MNTPFRPRQVKRSLGVKLMGLVVGLSLFSGLVMTISSTYFSVQKSKEHFYNSLASVVESSKNNLEEALWSFDQPAIERILSGFRRIEDVDSVQFHGVNNESTFLGEVYKTPLVEMTFQLKKWDEALGRDIELGTLIIQSNMRSTTRSVMAEALQKSLIEIVVVILGSLLCYYLIRSHVVLPLQMIANDLAKYDLSAPPKDLFVRDQKPQEVDEIDLIEDHVNHLKRSSWDSFQEVVAFNHRLEEMVDSRAKTILEQETMLAHARRWSSIGEMAGTIAHEINNPLAIIMAKAQLALRRNPTPESEKSLLKIIETTERISAIIKSLRVLSRDASGDPFEWVTLLQVSEDAMGLSRERLEKMGIEIVINDSLQDFAIFSRRVQIAQILLNLLGNARDALENWSGEKRVELKALERRGQLIVQIIDSGPGIPEEHRAKLMQPFFTTKEVGKGTGIGLTLSASIMSEHGGEIKFDFSQPQTTIELSFPKFQRRSRSAESAA